MDKNNEKTDMMKTFAILMSEMMINDLKPSKPIEIRKITAKTVVIETPFEDGDDIDLVLAAEFWQKIIKYFLVDEDTIRFGCGIDDYKFIEELKSEFLYINESEKNGIKYIEGPLSKNMKSIVFNNSTTEDGRIKWAEVYLIKDKEERVVLKRFGNECIVNNLNEKDINFISEVTSEYFALSYF